MARKPKAAPDPLRDHVAIRVMEILISGSARDFLEQVVQGNGPASFANVATISYAMADAMMKERG